MYKRSYDDYSKLKEIKYNFKQNISEELFKYGKTNNLLIDSMKFYYLSDFYILNYDNKREVYINVRVLPERNKEFFEDIIDFSTNENSSFQRDFNFNDKQKSKFYILFISDNNRELPFGNILARNNIKMITIRKDDIENFSIIETIVDDLEDD